MIRHLSIAVVLSFRLVAAETASISGPVAGYANRQEGIRPIAGVPGAAYFLPAVQLPGTRAALVSSRLRYAIAVGEDGSSAYMLDLGTAGREVKISGGDAKLMFASASPGGTSAILVREDSIDVVTGLPNSPAVRTVPAAQVKHAAVSDDGQTLAIIDANGVLSLLDSDGGVKPVASNVATAAFLPSGRNLVIAEKPPGAVVLRSDGVSTILTPQAADTAAAEIVATSPDARFIAVSSADSKQLTLIPAVGGNAISVVLPCSVQQLEFPSSQSILAGCGPDGGTHFIDLRSDEPRLLFVPEPGY